jgi:hypothetical protein
MQKTHGNEAGRPRAKSLNLNELESAVQLAVAQTIKSLVRRAAKEVAAKQLDKDSPNQEILTPEGCQALLHVGEKTLREYRREEPPIPSVYTNNSYRYPRADVLKWFSEKCLRETSEQLACR